MRNRLMLIVLALPALGGCSLFGGSNVEVSDANVRRAPLVIPPTFTLPPPGQAAAPAPAR